MTQQPKKSRRGLGRGLGALIQNTSEIEPEEENDTDSNESSEATQITDQAPAVDSTKPKDSIELRYLDGAKPARDRKRPSDLFFGDAGTSQTESTKHKASRAAMPNPILDRTRTSWDNEDSTETKVESGDGSLLNEILVDDIVPNPRQPRDEFDEESMIELVASISEVGVLQPVVVRTTETPNKYELIMGERRWRASKRAGLDTIPAIIRDTADEDMLREALLENIHRSELNALEEAAAYQQLMNDFGWSQEILSKRIGRSRPHISNTLRLMNLPPAIQRQVASGVLSAGHARAILGLSDQSLMNQLAQRVINESLSVRATEELATLMARNQEDAAKAPVRPRRNTQQFDEMASSLTDLLDTSVKITLGAKKGRIAIDFASVDDLNRIMAVISPESAD
ncbi:MAG TPA: ParB/RepB/Spo0J family partition protein [Candidatus Yaniella excrementigallinarum]|nr:ParB/RepB/Spo0J family partition protein [Candidatus Yaniella excrementigallinarum]